MSPVRRVRGLTLAEGLISLAMMAVCLAVVAGLFAQASRVLGHEERSDEALRAIRSCAQLLQGDLEQASFESIRPRAVQARSITFQRPDPALSISTLPLPAPEATPAVLKAPTAMSVRWGFQAGRLTREVGNSATVVAEGVLDFAIHAYEPDEGLPADAGGRVEYAIVLEGGAGGPIRMWDMVRPRGLAPPTEAAP